MGEEKRSEDHNIWLVKMISISKLTFNMYTSFNVILILKQGI